MQKPPEEMIASLYRLRAELDAGIHQTMVDAYPIGSRVRCRHHKKQEVEGEVIKHTSITIGIRCDNSRRLRYFDARHIICRVT